jgi:DNA adenine methylase
VHSREEFLRCRETWQSVNDPVERAGRWLYMVNYSFGSLGRNFGRATTGDGNIAGKLRTGVSAFRDLHSRLLNVQIENADWSRILKDYDSFETVFYLDPPYVDAYRGTYEYEMSIEQHRDMIRSIFQCRGFVAVSGYPNPLYDGQPWDARYDWEIQSTAKALAFQEENNKTHHDTDRGRVIECLWIKEAK